MSLRTALQPELVLDGPAGALLAAVEADPHAPLAVAIRAPGGHGKSALLGALAATYRRAGIPVADGRDEPPSLMDPDPALLVDDAHLLDDARLVELCRIAENGRRRLAVAYRPGPHPPALTELSRAVACRGRILPLSPFTPERTAAYLRRLGVPHAATAEFVHAQTHGIPRLVDRLGRALLGAGSEAAPPGQVPQAALLPFGAELDGLDPGLRRLLLAAASDVELPIDLLGALLVTEPEALDTLLVAARGTGLLGPDDRLPPLVRRAVAALSPATHRIAVWQRVAELQHRRGAPVLPLARPLLALGAAASAAAVFEAAAEEALPREPALAAELFAAAAAGGRATSARHAQAAALAGDLDGALRLADRLLAAADPAERAAGAEVAATALAHRGQLGRSAELHRWSGGVAARAFGAVAAAAVGEATELAELVERPPADGPPTLLTGAALLMARGVRETLSGSPTAGLSALVQSAALLEPAGPTVLLAESPAALAALAAVQCAEFDIGESVLERALAARTGGALLARRHQLLRAWILMVRGRTGAAAEALAGATAGAGRLEARDLLFAAGLQVGIARRNSDLAALHRGWAHAREALVRHPVDLFTLLPLGEFAIAAARLRDQARLRSHLDEAQALLDRLGHPPLWATPLRWSGLHAAILAEEHDTVDEQVAGLVATAGTGRYGMALAAAAQSWREVLRGVVDPARVEVAARGLHDVGLSWDAARLAGQAAIRTSDRRAMTALLDCARLLQGRPASHKQGGAPADPAADPALAAPVAEGRLSEREREVAELVLAGLTYKQIGDRLFISAKTVEHHVARMRQRLGCANRAELLARLRALFGGEPGGHPPQPRRPSD